MPGNIGIREVHEQHVGSFRLEIVANITHGPGGRPSTEPPARRLGEVERARTLQRTELRFAEEGRRVVTMLAGDAEHRRKTYDVDLGAADVVPEHAVFVGGLTTQH